MQAQKNFVQAAGHLFNAERIAERLVAESPGDPESKRSLANSLSKTATLFLAQNLPNVKSAVDRLDKAISIFEDIVQRDPDHEAYLSNLATAQGLKARSLGLDRPESRDRSIPDCDCDARAARETKSRFYRYCTLSRYYERLGADISKIGENEKAADAYRSALEWRRLIAAKEPRDADQQKKLAEIQKKLESLERLPTKKPKD